MGISSSQNNVIKGVAMRLDPASGDLVVKRDDNDMLQHIHVPAWAFPQQMIGMRLFAVVRHGETDRLLLQDGRVFAFASTPITLVASLRAFLPLLVLTLIPAVGALTAGCTLTLMALCDLRKGHHSANAALLILASASLVTLFMSNMLLMFLLPPVAFVAGIAVATTKANRRAAEANDQFFQQVGYAGF